MIDAKKLTQSAYKKIRISNFHWVEIIDCRDGSFVRALDPWFNIILVRATATPIHPKIRSQLSLVHGSNTGSYFNNSNIRTSVGIIDIEK